MKNITLLITLLFFISANAQNNVPVSSLPVADTIGAPDFYPVVQGGHYKRVSVGVLSTQVDSVVALLAHYADTAGGGKIATQHQLDSLTSGPVDWSTLGNAGINQSVNFIGTTDNNPIPFRTNNNLVGGFLPDGSFFNLTGAGMIFGNGNLTPVGLTDSTGMWGIGALGFIKIDNRAVSHLGTIQIQVPSTGSIILDPNVVVNGQFTVANGSQADGNILSCDANGRGTWVLPTSLGEWNLTGNTGTNSGTSTLGTNDNASLNISTADTNRLTVDSLGNVWIGYVNGPQLPGVYGFNVDGPTALYGGVENKSSGLTIAANTDSTKANFSYSNPGGGGTGYAIALTGNLFSVNSTDNTATPFSVNMQSNAATNVQFNNTLITYLDAAGTFANTGYVATTDGHGNLSYTNITATQVNDTLITPSSGGSFVCANGQTGAIFIGSGTATTFTLTLPPGVNDGFRFNFLTNGTSLITSLTFATSDGSSIGFTNPFQISNKADAYLIYHASSNTWY